MVFVRDVLADPMIKNNLQRHSVDNLICMSTDGSKLVIMNDKGTLRYYGAGWIHQDGIYYSNKTFKPWKAPQRWKKNGKGYGVYVNGKKVKDDKQIELVETTTDQERQRWEEQWDSWAICTQCGGDLEEIDEYSEYYECLKCNRIFDWDYRVVYEDDDIWKQYLER